MEWDEPAIPSKVLLFDYSVVSALSGGEGGVCTTYVELYESFFDLVLAIAEI